MKKKTIKTLIMILLFVMPICANKVYGYSCDIDVTQDNEEIKSGESVTYELKSTNIDAGNGIAFFQANVEYNSDIFELTIEETENWSKTNGGIIGNTIYMNRNNGEAGNEEEVVARLCFTAKSNISLGDKTIVLSSIQFVSDDYQLIEVEDKTLNVTIVEDNGNNNENGEDGENTGNNEENNKTDVDNNNNDENNIEESGEDETEINIIDTEDINSTTSENSLDANTSPTALPYTGIWGLAKIIIFVASIGLAYMFYKKHNELKNI